MVLMAAYTEVLGAIALLLGLAVRWLSVPLIFTMGVAAVTVHLKKAGRPSRIPPSASSTAPAPRRPRRAWARPRRS